MKTTSVLSTLVATFLGVFPLIAQQSPGNIAVLEFQKPKSGMALQYEAGRKQKAAWHKQQNDPQPLLVFEALSGDHTGTYVVGRFGQHWADFDKPAIPDETDVAEYEKVLGSYVESLTTRYYEFLPKVSHVGEMTAPSKFSEILTFYAHYGKGQEFRAILDQICEAVQKTKWPPQFQWYALANGGSAGEFVLAIPHKNWAEFGDDPNVKPFRDMLKEAFGQAQSDSIINRIDDAVEKETSEIVQFRPDLSYLPEK